MDMINSFVPVRQTTFCLIKHVLLPLVSYILGQLIVYLFLSYKTTSAMQIIAGVIAIIRRITEPILVSGESSSV